MKFDYNLSKSDTMMVRWSGDSSRETVSQPHPLFHEHTTAYTRYFTVQDQHLFSSTTMNTFRFAANRTNRTDDLLPDGIPGGIPQSLYFSTDPHFGAIDLSQIGAATAGSVATTPVNYTQDIFQFSDTLTWNKGSHVVKAGMDLQDYHFDGFSYSRWGGTFRFGTMTQFLQGVANQFTGNLPGTDTNRKMRQWYDAFYVQDSWRAADTLTVDYGLRYDFITTPRELNNEVAGLVSLDDLNTTANGVTPGTPMFKNPSLLSFAPRLGIAWNPLGDKKSTIKAGYGSFYQPLTTSFYRGTSFRIYPYFAGVSIRNPPVFGPAMIDVLNAGVNPSTVQKRSEFIDYDAKQPCTDQWHVHYDRDLGHRMTAEFGYLGSAGHNLPFYGDPNTTPSQYVDGVKMLVPGATIRYPAWGRIRTRVNDAHSTYEGLTASWTKRYSNNWQAQVSYTYGNSHDDWSGGQIGGADFDNAAGSASDWWDPNYEWGPSNFDIRHTLVMNATYVFPFFADKTGVAAGPAQELAGGRRRAVRERPAVHGARELRPDRRRPGGRRPAEAESQRTGHLYWHGGAVVRPVGVQRAGGAGVRQRGAQHAARTRPARRGPLAVQEPEDRQVPGAVQARGVQRLQHRQPGTPRLLHLQHGWSPQPHGGQDHHDGDRRPSGAARDQVHVLMRPRRIRRQTQLTPYPPFQDNALNGQQQLGSSRPRLGSHRAPHQEANHRRPSRRRAQAPGRTGHGAAIQDEPRFGARSVPLARRDWVAAHSPRR